ncbi:unnamed protein product, partial [Aphanomyces euteiches]
KLEAKCQFFEKMDALFGERPNVMPSHIMEVGGHDYESHEELASSLGEHTSKRYTLDDSQGEYDSADDDVNSENEDNSGDEDTVGLKQYWAACADDDPGKFNNSEPTRKYDDGLLPQSLKRKKSSLPRAFPQKNRKQK